MVVVKKYPNRRLYDTSESRYITLDDLAARVRSGSDVLVQDAQSGADLTQATLTQIILESRGGARLLPVPLLVRLIRLGDEALAEFFGRYVSWALEVYIQAKQGARALLPLNPLATAPFAATDALARLVLGAAQHLGRPGAVAPAEAVGAPGAVEDVMPPPPATTAGPLVDEEPSPRRSSTADVVDEMARLREEIEVLKRTLRPDDGTAERAPAPTRARPAKSAARRRTPR